MAINMFERKILKMSDDECYETALEYGRIMERGSMTKIEIHRAGLIFNECANRSALDEHKEIFLTAIRVLRFF